MPQRNAGARLYFRRSAGAWIIRDGSKYIRTGLAYGELGEAKKRLADYIAQTYRPARVSGRHPAQIRIADVLNIYVSDRGPKVARPGELAQRIAALDAFFGERMLDSVNGSACRDYASQRGSISLARRELEDLRAAINYHRREGLCSEVVEVVLPDKSVPRERWLTRSEAARLLWAAWRGGQGKRKHVARFILVGLYTGTRAGAICAAAFRPTVGRGHIDLAEGVFYRRAAGKRETKKRQPAIRLDGRLLAHLRRWAAADPPPASVVEWKGGPIARMAKAFRNAARDAGLPDVHPHVLRHSAVTWAMQGGADMWKAAGHFGMSAEMLMNVYGHHHPSAGKDVAAAIRARR